MPPPSEPGTPMTVYSMTAFARRDAHTAWGDLAWEIRSVNHRYLDISRRLPDALRALEPAVREAVAARLKRGKVDLLLTHQPGEVAGQLDLDEELLRRLVDLAHRVEVLAHNVTSLSTADLLNWPGVVKTAEVDEEGLRKAALDLLDQALDDLLATRAREGARLAELIVERLDRMRAVVEELRGFLPELVPAHRRRLAERLAELRDELEPGRLEQEIVLFAQKADVTEELDRLAAHIKEVRRVLDKGGPVGRRLDFLMQELNREANTLGSKAADLRLTNAAVELKVLIEQMREQVQNIE